MSAPGYDFARRWKLTLAYVAVVVTLLLLVALFDWWMR